MRSPDRYEVLCILIGLLYSINELLQHLTLGPNWIRWYLSDFAFPMAIATMLFVASGAKWPMGFGIVAGAVIGIATEAIQFSRGHGDPIDVACFIGGMLVGLAILGRRPK